MCGVNYKGTALSADALHCESLFSLVHTICAHCSVVLNGSGHVGDYDRRGRENRTAEQRCDCNRRKATDEIGNKLHSAPMTWKKRTDVLQFDSVYAVLVI